MKNILTGQSIPTAVFCAIDSFAFGAIKCAYDFGCRIPEDISFSGIDNVFFADYLSPGLTTIDIDKEQIGALAMDMIVKKIANKPVESVTVKSDTLLVRDSVHTIDMQVYKR